MYGRGIKERNFYEKNKINYMIDKNKEAIKILITEVDKNDWALGGIITADKEH